MADIHLNTTGSNTAPYDTWAKAATSWATAVTGMVAGDRLLVDSTFGTYVAGVSLTFPGTPANPNQILSGTPAATSGLSALAAGALCATNNTSLGVSGSFYCYGVTFISNTASATYAGWCGNTGNVGFFENCSFQKAGGSSGYFYFGAGAVGSGSYVNLLNCSFHFSSSTSFVSIDGRVDILGGSCLTGSSTPNTMGGMFSVGNSRSANLSVVGFDFSNLSSTAGIAAFESAGCFAAFSDCRLPPAWTGVFLGGTIRAGMRLECHNFDNAGTSHRFNISDYQGTAREDATIYVTGSLTDGVALSDKITTTANVKYPMCVKSRWLYAYDAGAGSAKVATVQCARDGSATPYNDNEVWLEVETLGTTGYPTGVMSHDRIGALATPAAQTASATAWTGLGGVNNKMALAASYTPRNAGYVRARVCFAAPSATVYYEPLLTLA